ncbi:hypothetical protein BIW11_03712 [Tropilaelaps mercedesae]|uniref:Uncharacterized protein n=1 Tax=Tropilaelaps mercedesae TaxID=418985 RepID=A0A1V9XGW9_9ACAR|nr:hypothetical protein BIW11_03712 [Tropilaelaps mercedesae]
MQGNYTCRVETDKSVSENDFYLIVIVDSCKEQSWTTYSDRIDLSCTLCARGPAQNGCATGNRPAR